jgi:hypothetical protein
MAKTLNVAVPHHLGTAEAIKRVSFGMTQFEATFGRAAVVEQTNWSGDQLAWTVRIAGVRLTGTTTVTDDNVVVQAELPLVFAPFAQRADGLIQKYGAMLLAGMPQPERPKPQPATPEIRGEIRQRAVAAAKAAGHRWSRLSQGERTSFRMKAREEMGLKVPAPPSNPS